MALLIYVKQNPELENQLNTLKSVVDSYPEKPDIVFYCKDISDERILFMHADYFITTRDINTVRWSTYTDT